MTSARSNSLAKHSVIDHELMAYVNLPAVLAEAGFGIPISDSTRQNWADALFLIQKVDDALDSGSAGDGTSFIAAAENAIDHDYSEAMIPSQVSKELGTKAVEASFRLKANLSPEQAAKFIRFGGYIIRMRQEMKNQSDVDIYSEFTRREAEILAMMIGTVMNQQEQSHPDYKRFMGLLKSAGGSYNIYDSLIDLKADHRTGLTPITPTIANHLKMIPPMAAGLIGNMDTLARLSLKPKLWGALYEPLSILIKDRKRGAEKRDNTHSA